MIKYVTRIFWGERFAWNVDLTPEQVLRKVGAKNEGTWLQRIFAPGIGAETSRDTFTLSNMSLGNIPLSGNGFVHVLNGRVRPTPGGSHVTAQFRLALPVFVFSTLWLGLAFFIGIVGAVSNMYRALLAQDLTLAGEAVMMIAAPVLGTAFLNVFRMLGWENEKKLKAALFDALGNPVAHDRTDPSLPPR